MHNNINTNEQLLSTKEVAKILGVTTGCLANWRYQDKAGLAWIRIGGSVRYKSSDVQAFINSCSEGSV